MRLFAILALLLGLSGGAQAFTLFEIEPNDCFCEATPGGNEQTTLLQGTLSGEIVLRDGIYADSEDYYRFDFSGPVAYFSARPVTPDIAEDDTYRIFDIEMYRSVVEGDLEFFDPVTICDDCWFGASALEAYDLPAGTYYIVVADLDAPFTPAMALANIDQPPPDQEFPVESRGLGAYSVAIATTTVPEPASLALFGTALAGLALRRRRA